MNGSIDPSHLESLARLRKQGWITQAQADNVMAALEQAPPNEYTSPGYDDDSHLLAWLLWRGTLTPADLDATLARLQSSLGVNELEVASEAMSVAPGKLERVRAGVTWESLASLHRAGLISEDACDMACGDTTWAGTPASPQQLLASLVWMIDAIRLERAEVDALIERIAQDPARADWLPALREAELSFDQHQRERMAVVKLDPADFSELFDMRRLALLTPAQFDAAVARMRAEELDSNDILDIDDCLLWLLCRGVVTVESLRRRLNTAGAQSSEDHEDDDERPSAQVRRALVWFELAEQGITREAVEQLGGELMLETRVRHDLLKRVGRNASQAPHLGHAAQWMAGTGLLTPKQVKALQAHLRADTRMSEVSQGDGDAASAASLRSSPGATSEDWPIGRLVILVLIGVALYGVWRFFRG